MQSYNVFHSRYLVSSIILIFVNMTFYGCYSLRETTIENNNRIKIYKIETVDGNVIDFQNNKPGYAFLLDNNIVHIKSDGEKEIFSASNIKKYYAENFDFGKTFALVIGSAALVLVLAIGLGFLIMSGRGLGD